VIQLAVTEVAAAFSHDDLEAILCFTGDTGVPIGDLPSGKHTKNYGKSQCFMGKSTINGHFQ
jgi:hypothetical protein